LNEQLLDHKEFGVTLDLFHEWRAPRFGQVNPTRMDNKLWEWLIRTRLGAYQAKKVLGDPSISAGEPTWSFDRFGQTSTTLPDGRTIFIGGEHEDYYDPDFCIYNDVVVVNPDESVEIYGYPEHVFPPTDFHTSTRLGNTMLVIGNLGYRDKRLIGATQLLALNLDGFEIEQVRTTGTAPGWLHQHTAKLVDDGEAILITQGKLYAGQDRSLIENIDDWKLHLDDWRWERLTERRWARWEVRRSDRSPNHLWNMRQALFDRNMKWHDSYLESIERIAAEIGKEPDIDLIADLYRPGLPHENVPREEYNVFQIAIEGVTVRYVEDLYSIQVTVEGTLPENIIAELKSDLLEKLATLENAPCEVEMI